MVVEEIAPNLFRLELPLQDKILKHVNSYVIRGSQRNLVVDTGDYHDDCLQAMTASLRDLSVDLSRTDFFVTHYHVDHIGVALRLTNDGSALFINKVETEMIRALGSGDFLADIKGFFSKSGFPGDDPEKIVPPVVSGVYKYEEPQRFRFVADGDTIDLGDFRFISVATPGHSGGHMCLYEAGKKFLLSGDHLLGDITPAVQGRNSLEDPLNQYLSSLEKIRGLDIRLVLPGHKTVFGNHRERIVQIEEHHRQRTNSIISILRSGSKNAYEVASQMVWNVDCASWDSFPLLQSFFATEEAFAHLTYLEHKGEIWREMQGQLAVFSMKK